MSGTMPESPRRWMSSTKRKAGTEVWYGRGPEDLPYRKLAPLDSEIFAAYTGPGDGLCLVDELEKQLPDGGAQGAEGVICGSEEWKKKNRKAYGISTSLYDQHPIKKVISGDPIADSFAICARLNNCVMIIADGVNWGEKSMLAARCAVYGAAKYINEQFFGPDTSTHVKNTHDVFLALLRSLEAAHKCILRHNGGLTTLCVAAVLPTRVRSQYVVCIANVGDSLAYVFSKFHGVREITTGSHDIRSERDIRDAGGAIGPVNGTDPELNNLTCSMTYVDVGDIVYLTTDGISDNYDPVVTKIAVPKQMKPPDIPEPSETETKDSLSGGVLETGKEAGEISGDKNVKNSSDTAIKNQDAISNQSIQGNSDVRKEENENLGEVQLKENGRNYSLGEGSSCAIGIENQNKDVTVLDSKNSSQDSSVTNSLNQNAGNIESLSTEDTENTPPGGELINQINANVVTGSDNHSGNIAPRTDNLQNVMQQGENSETNAENLKNSQQSKNSSIKSDSVSVGKSKTLDSQVSTESTQSQKRHGGVIDKYTLLSCDEQDDDMSCRTKDGKPEMAPHERHQYAVKEMEKVVLEYELMTEDRVCAQELCGALLHHVLKLTNSKRNVLEDPNLYGKKLRPKDRKRRDSEIVAKMSRAPGKLDHASIVAYEVGRYHGDADENYENGSGGESDVYGSDGNEWDGVCDQELEKRDADDVIIPMPACLPVSAAMDIPFIDDSEESDVEH